MKKLLFLPAVFIGAAGLFATELYRYTFRREGSPLLSLFLDKKGHEEAYYVKRDTAADQLRSRTCERMQIRSARGEMLTGYYYPCGAEGKRIAFLVHGYRSEHAETAGLFYPYYASRGIDLFCCDHTAHGSSEGKQIGFDYYESGDCLCWIEALRNRFGDDIQIILHGFSMGAATVMKMSNLCPKQVRFLVADCGYADGSEQLKASLGALYPLMRGMNRLIAGYDLRNTDVRPSLTSAQLPILFVHGKNDTYVPFENAKKLFTAYSGPKDCFFVDGARHMECIYRDPLGYAEKLDSFLLHYFS